jgi:integrase
VLNLRGPPPKLPIKKGILLRSRQILGSRNEKPGSEGYDKRSCCWPVITGSQSSCWAEVLRCAASLAENDALRLAPFLPDPRKLLPHIRATALDEVEPIRREHELATLLQYLKGHWLYMPTLLAAYTALRRGEVLGLRWRDIDFANAMLQVTQAVQEVGGKLTVKTPKTDKSARTINLPASLLPELECHRKEQLEQRLKLGLGGRPELVFTSPLGQMLRPNSLSEAFANKVAELDIKQITFHGLRHTHITHLLKSGVPVHVVSARAGHAKASTTLDTYSHLLGHEDAGAADKAEEMLQRILK